jgi:hypothetical protein
MSVKYLVFLRLQNTQNNKIHKFIAEKKELLEICYNASLCHVLTK